MDRTTALIATLGAGALLALQPPANASLARVVGDLGAAFVSIALSGAIVGMILLAVGDVGRLARITDIKPEHLLGGFAGAAVVGVSLVAVRSLGAGGVTAALVAMQLTVATVLDRFGLLGLPEVPLSWHRLFGVLLLLGGTALVTLR
jgi:bacterial/archaeal transporter family-2 protein